jgi:hypothetical protein
VDDAIVKAMAAAAVVGIVRDATAEEDAAAVDGVVMMRGGQGAVIAV